MILTLNICVRIVCVQSLAIKLQRIIHSDINLFQPGHWITKNDPTQPIWPISSSAIDTNYQILPNLICHPDYRQQPLNCIADEARHPYTTINKWTGDTSLSTGYCKLIRHNHVICISHNGEVHLQANPAQIDSHEIDSLATPKIIVKEHKIASIFKHGMVSSTSWLNTECLEYSSNLHILIILLKMNACDVLLGPKTNYFHSIF